MHTHKTFAGTNKTFHRRLLLIVEYVAGGEQENHGLIFLQFFIAENAGVFVPIQRKVMTLGHGAHGGHTFVDGFMVKAIGFGKQQHIKLLCLSTEAGEQ